MIAGKTINLLISSKIVSMEINIVIETLIDASGKIQKEIRYNLVDSGKALIMCSLQFQAEERNVL